MDNLYIYHHLGMGDHISCNGLVRHFCESYKKVFLFVKPMYAENVKRMYVDLKNIDFIIGDDNFVTHYINTNKISNLIKIGFEKLNQRDNFELQFYNHAAVPIEYKHSKFYIERNLEKEIELFNKLQLEPNNYIFLHRGGKEIKNELLNKNYKIVEPNDFGIFDWMYVIENAKEIHCIDSSFICLVDCMKLNENIKLYNHRYVRKYPEYVKLYTNKNWIVFS
jgi:hypothetical protein